MKNEELSTYSTPIRQSSQLTRSMSDASIKGLMPINQKTTHSLPRQRKDSKKSQYSTTPYSDQTQKRKVNQKSAMSNQDIFMREKMSDTTDIRSTKNCSKSGKPLDKIK